MNKPKMKQMQLPENFHKKLNELSDKRKSEGHVIKSMTAIICELIDDMHEKEIGKNNG